MLFCPRCGRIKTRCKCEANQISIESLKRILRREIEAEKEDIRREAFDGIVVDVQHDMATIECSTYPKFDEGDVIGYISGDKVKPLGVVVIPGKELTVALERSIEEGARLKLCDAEILVGYELQLKILDELDDNLKRIVFEDFEFPEIRKVRAVRGKNLDDFQREVVECIVSLDDGELLLVVGPPGTGKTTVICEAVRELYRDHKILITSHTNRAVDNALERLGRDFLNYAVRVGRPEKILPSIREFMLSYKARTLLGKWLEEVERKIRELKESIREINRNWREFKVLGRRYKEVLAKRKEELKELYGMRNEMLRMVSEGIVEKARIVGSTLIKSQLFPLESIDFDMVLIDECSQVSISLALLGMAKAKKWVLIGDHNQLLPIFRSIEDDDMLRRLSSFCHLMRYENRVKWLRLHYRSNEAIIQFSSRYIYDGKIIPHPKCRGKRINVKLHGFLSGDKPVVFLNVPGRERYDFKVKSRYNEEEIFVVESIVKVLMKNGVKDIGVITPFRAQRTLIKDRVEEVEVNTVDSYQGREKSVIIYSVTATSEKGIEFAGNRNRFNVAVTRAVNKLIVVGNGKAMYENDLLSKFIEYAIENGGYYDAKVISSSKPSKIQAKPGDKVKVTINSQTIYGTLIEKDPIIVQQNEKIWFLIKP